MHWDNTIWNLNYCPFSLIFPSNLISLPLECIPRRKKRQILIKRTGKSLSGVRLQPNVFRCFNNLCLSLQSHHTSLSLWSPWRWQQEMLCVWSVRWREHLRSRYLGSRPTAKYGPAQHVSWSTPRVSPVWSSARPPRPTSESTPARQRTA